MAEEQVYIKIRGEPAPEVKKGDKRTKFGDPGRMVGGEKRAAGEVVQCAKSDGRLVVALGGADYCTAEGELLAQRAQTGGLGVDSGLVAGRPATD